MNFRVRIYNAHNETKVYVKKEFQDSSFEDMDDCMDYWKKQYPFNNISVSQIIDGMGIGEKLQELNREEKKRNN